jgi:steroid delta-isomerase-like uncharacterized protein
MSSEQNKELVRRYLEAWGAGDIDRLAEMLDENSITHDPSSGDLYDAEFELNACRIWHASFSDVQLSIEQLLAEDDKVSTYWLLVSTHDRDFMGIAPTGKRVSVAGMEINRIADGKIAEIWRISDTMSLMEQLGAV